MALFPFARAVSCSSYPPAHGSIRICDRTRRLPGSACARLVITGAGELHAWYLGEWRQEFFITRPKDYRIMLRALDGLRVIPDDSAFGASEAALGSGGISRSGRSRASGAGARRRWLCRSTGRGRRHRPASAPAPRTARPRSVGGWSAARWPTSLPDCSARAFAGTVLSPPPGPGGNGDSSAKGRAFSAAAQIREVAIAMGEAPDWRFEV